MEIVDNFEYKGKQITVQRDRLLNHYFTYKEGEKNVILSKEQIESFINSSFSHTTINNNVVDMIEKSVKINDFLFNLKDLKIRLKKYD